MTRRRLKARRDRRGRPRKAGSRYRATTAAGRRPIEIVDLGTPELRAQREAATSRRDLPNDLLGALYGRALIDLDGYNAGLAVAGLVRTVRLSLGLTEASAAAQWRNILSAHAGGTMTLLAGSHSGAEGARRILARIKRELGRAAWRAVADAVDNAWPAPQVFAGWLVNLRLGLKHLARRLPARAKAAAG